MKNTTLLLLLSLSFFIQKNLLAQALYGEEELYYAPKFEVQSPLPNGEIPISNYSVSAEKASTLTYPSGTKIIIPSNAFVYANGEIVTGKVDIQYREFNNPLDIYLSGIPMSFIQDGKKEFFQSAGMVEIRASQNGKEVFPNPSGEMINIELTSNQLEDDFQMYNLNEVTGGWEENGKDEVLWNSKDIIPEELETTSGDNLIQRLNTQNQAPRRILPPVAPTLRPSYVSFDLLNWDSKKQMRKLKKRKHLLKFKIKCDGYKSSKPKGNHLIKGFSELKDLEKVVWVYDGEEKRETVKFLKKIKHGNVWVPSGDSLKSYDLEDMVITPNFEKDNYQITFHCQGFSKTIEAYPFLSTTSPTIEQKRNRKFYKKYKSKYQKRLTVWKELEVIHEEQMKGYQVRLEAFQEEVRKLMLRNSEEQILALLSPHQIRNGVTRRRVQVYTFGILNIDKLLPRLDEELLVQFKLENDNAIEFSKVVVFDQTNNAMLAFVPGEKIKFDSSGKSSLLVILENDMGAIVKAEDFQKSYKNRKNGKMTFKVAPIVKEKISKQALSDVLASN